MTARRVLLSFSLAGLLLLSALLAGKLAPPAASAARTLPPLRVLPQDRSYELRVLYLEDRRLPTLTAARRRDLYAKIECLLNDWYGYRATLREVDRRNLSDYFSAQERVFAGYADLDHQEALALKHLRDTIARDFRARPLPLIERYLQTSPLTSKTAAIEIAQQRFQQKLTELREAPLADDSPFFDADQPRLSSFPHWGVLTAEITEADLVFTNSMIAGADTTMPIYVIARGGLTTRN